MSGVCAAFAFSIIYLIVSSYTLMFNKLSEFVGSPAVSGVEFQIAVSLYFLAFSLAAFTSLLSL